MRYWLSAIIALTTSTIAGPALGHEAWLLTPDELIALAQEPIPPLFTDRWLLTLIGFMTALAAATAAWIGDRLAPMEERACRPLAALAADIGPLCIRLGLACMLGLGSLGALPRHGTPAWTQPTLFVPDMQLSLAAPWWSQLAFLQLAVAMLLAVGWQTRLAALGVAALCGLGSLAFGSGFVAYAPHFLAPALLLALYGGGRLSFDGALAAPWRQPLPKAMTRQAIWRVALALFGVTFVYHGIAYKLMQPTLIMAILKHGDVPTFAIPLEMAALIMAVVEIGTGTLLALGRLVRPIALFLIGAFTFFALTLGETPLFHANLYGAMAMLVLAGQSAPSPVAARGGYGLVPSKQKG